MKKLMIVSMLLMSIAVSAQQISVDGAKKTAEQFFEQVNSQQSTSNLRIAKTAKPQNLTLAYTAKIDEGVAFYAFNNEDGGFVITAGDEVAEPVLAYSDRGSFDAEHINPNLKYWLGMYEKEIANAQNQQPNIRTPKRQVIKTAKKDVPVLVPTRWDQESPYYNSIKSYTGKSYLTGCVATAMSQIMKTNEWPVKGKGSHTYTDTDWSGKTYTRNFSEHTYDWKNMLNTYTSSATAAQNTAVAELMFDAGVSVEMGYGTSSQGGSGAMTEDCAYAYVNYFGYDEGVFHRYRDYYTLDEWSEIVYSELAAGRPMMYGGADTEGGHSFICDGYKSSTDQYHFNWGWSGDGDCYCKLSAVKGGGYTWSYLQDVVAGIQKPVEGSKPKPYLILYDNCDLNITKAESSSGYKFTCKCGTYKYNNKSYQGYIINDAWKAFNCVFAMMYVNQETGERFIAKPADLTKTKTSFPTIYPILKQNFNVSGVTLNDVKLPAMPAGNYRVYLAYKDDQYRDDDSVEWEYVRGYSDKTYWIEETVEYQIDAPEVQEATDITATGFTANWSEVKDAQSYTLQLTSKEKDAKEDQTLIDEDFSGFSSYTSDGTSDINSKLDQYMKTEGWSGSKVYASPSKVKIGSSTAGGSLTTPSLTANGKVTVVLNVSQYGSENTIVTLEIGSEKFDVTPSGKDQEFSAEISGDFNVKVSTASGKKRFYVSKVLIKAPGGKTETKVIDGITENKYVFTGLTDEFIYTYKVKAVTDKGMSDWSAEQSVECGTSEIPGDIDGDGYVNVTDVVELNQRLLDGTTGTLNPKVADINEDGVINVTDIVDLIAKILK